MEKPKTYGEMAFLGGIGLAVLLGIGSGFLPQEMMPIIWGVLALLGLAVGFLNINEKEMVAFLVAAIGLLSVPNALSDILAILKTLPAGVVVSTVLSGFLGALIAFMSPAVFVVAIKAIYNLAKSD